MLINGKRTDQLQANNRGLAYGDGLFETIRVHARKTLFLQQHLDRLQRGLERLGIADCRSELLADLESVDSDLPDTGVLKIMVTRGAGGRGYRDARGASPDRILSLHDLPPPADETGIQVFQCREGLSHNPRLAGIKHLNRLEQVLASLQWPGDAFHEGLMLDPHGLIIEGTRSNIFIALGGRLYTPDLSNCGIEGVLRQVLIDELDDVRVRDIPVDMLAGAEEIFFCNSVAGIWPVLSLHLADGTVISRPSGKWTGQAEQIFARALDALK